MRQPVGCWSVAGAAPSLVVSDLFRPADCANQVDASIADRTRESAPDRTDIIGGLSSTHGESGHVDRLVRSCLAAWVRWHGRGVSCARLAAQARRGAQD